MHFSARSFIGKTTVNFWSQYWENEPDDPIKVSSKGHLFGLISLKTAVDKPDLNLIGRSLIEDLTANYYSDPANISTSILSSVKNINLPHDSDIKVSLMICVVRHPQIYFYSLSDGEIYLLRDHQFAKLSGQPTPTPIAGTVYPDDKILLISPKFSQSLTLKNVKSYLNLPISDLEENFSSHLFSLPDQNDLSALYINTIADDEVPLIATKPEMSQPEVVSPVFQPEVPSPLSAPQSPHLDQPQYIQNSDTGQMALRKKISLVVALILILLLSGSVIYSFRRNRQNQIEVNYQTLKSSLDQKITDANTVKSLNLDASLKAAQEAGAIYNQLLALKVHPDDLKPYSDQIQQLLSVSGSDQTFPGKELYDTSLISKNPQYSKIFLSRSKLSLLDSQNGRVDEVDIDKKSYRNLSQTDLLKDATKIYIDQGNLYTLYPSKLSQIDNNKITKNFEFNTAQNNFTVNDMAVWNGNFYLLTPDNIYKLSQNPDGFTTAKTWLKDSQSLPTNPASIAINGRIWVISTSGTIYPYNLGVKENFKPLFSPDFIKVRSLVISVDKDVLFFVDGDTTIYAYNKDGSSLAKFNFGDKKILDIAYDENLNKIYTLCSDQKIYSISL